VASFQKIDAQVHLNFFSLEKALLMMEENHINSVVIDEWWGPDEEGFRQPNYRLPSGEVRYLYSYGVDAAVRYPSRFAYTAWVDWRDPQIDKVVEFVKDNPHQVCLRVTISPQRREDIALADGLYHPLFSAAQRHGVPMMICLPRISIERRLELLLPYLGRWTELKLIIDHCGIFPMSAEDIEAGLNVPETINLMHAYAAFPNVAIKWGHAPLLSRRSAPFEDLIQPLGMLIEKFGAQRVMWCSDTTQTNWHHSWFDSYSYIQDSSELSTSERSWVLGESCRSILDWPPKSSVGGASNVLS
jgi:predicted TIM-barrel fold metal-dependent hydrolase